MQRQLWSLTLAAAATVSFTESVARAASPTTPECLAASNASLQLGNQHKFRAERAQLLVCAATSCPTDIRKECMTRVAEVNAQLSTVIFEVKDVSGVDLTAVKITMDGAPLADKLDGTALAVDPGEHTFTFAAVGQAPATKKFMFREAQKDRHEAVTLGRSAAVAGLPSPAAAGAGLGTQKVLALVAGGVGVAGLGVGTAFGLIAMSKRNDAQSSCPATQCPTRDGVGRWSDAGSAANISTVGFIVGGVGVIGAAVLWLTAPSADGGPCTQVGFGPGGLQVRGAF